MNNVNTYRVIFKINGGNGKRVRTIFKNISDLSDLSEELEKLYLKNKYKPQRVYQLDENSKIINKYKVDNNFNINEY